VVKSIRDAMEKVIETTNLTKTYKKILAVNNLNLTIYEKDVFGFLGPNGAGKTTTIKMMMGITKPTKGSVKILGYDVFKDGVKAKMQIGFVPDQFDFYPELNAVEHLNYYASLFRIPKEERCKRINELLEMVGLSERKNSKVKTYSHGMRQRLVIAQALINKPKLLVLDEPTVGLDPKGSYETRQLIKKLGKEIPIFISSHLLYEVQEVCNKVGIINNGKLLRVDSINNLTKLGGEVNVQIECTNMNDRLTNAVRGIDGVVDLSADGNILKAKVKDSGVIPEIVTVITREGGRIKSVSEVTLSLEDAFLRLTGEKNEG